MNIKLADNEAKSVAKSAADTALRNRGGDGFPCGFSWVVYVPKNKGNTKEGRAERRLVESVGFRVNYTGKVWELWNPSDTTVQNVDIKLAGAEAYAKKFSELTGLSVYANSRLD